MSIQHDENKPLYGSRGIDIYLKLIRHKYHHVDINKLLEYAGMEYYQVKDEGHFFSQKQINRFYEKIVELTGNKNIAREAGRFSGSPESSSTLWRSVLGLISPVKYYELLGKYANKITRSSEYKAKRLSSNKVEVTVTPYPGTKEEPFQCENRMGYWEAVSTFYKLKPPKIEHSECLFKGGKRCRYYISWPKSPVIFLKKIRNICLFLMVLTCFLLPGIIYFVDPSGLSLLAFISFFSLFITGILIINWFLKKIETTNLLETIELLRGSADELMEQVDINYENSLLINEVGQILAKVSDLDDIFNKVLKVLHSRLNYDRAIIMLSNLEKTRLVFQVGYGYNDEQLSILRKISFHLDKPDSKGIFALSFHKKEPQLLNDIEEIKGDLSPRSYEFALKMGVRSVICCPVIYENEALGILAVDNINSKKPLLQRDLNLLMGIALQIGSRLHTVKIESHLRQVQKMEAVGNLAGGVAHDFNNILTTILGYSQMISMKLSMDDPIWKMVDSIYHAGVKASDLTHQLLAFSRKQVLKMKVTNLNIIVEDMNKMLGRLIGEDVILKTYLTKPIGNIMADPSQVGQILMNLVVNARDAMPHGGRLTIETGDISLDHQHMPSTNDIKPGSYSMLSVTDTGTGMAPELQEKVFEPFFTTKEPGKGTGLGLSTVYGIVNQHQGQIHIYSEPNQGTSFKVYFPISDVDLEEEEAISDNIVMPRGSEIILVVDDDEAIRSLILDTLQPLGYKTMEASSGKEALDLFLSTSQKIDLVLSDVIMPGMNGKELIDRLREEQPDLKTILMSGYTDNVIAHHGVLNYKYTLINKPLLPVMLANKIRSILDNNVTADNATKTMPGKQ